MSDRSIFISHVHEDSDLAVGIKELMEDAFAGVFDAFVSSDRRSLSAGDNWLQKITENIKRADDFIILLTPRSLGRPWVNFEAGAAFGKGRSHIIPVCTRGLTFAHVGPPLNSLQLHRIETIADVVELIEAIARQYNFKPKPDKEKMEAVLKLAQPRADDLPPPLTPEAKAKETLMLGKLREEWDALMLARQTFWETLGQYYASKFMEKEGYPDTIEALVDLSDVPSGLPLSAGEHLREYPAKYGRLLVGKDSLLYKFSSSVYPSKQPTLKLEDCTALPPAAFQIFHKSRGDLAKFWNRWGEAVYLGGLVGLDTIIKGFDAHFRLLKLLSYLEVCLTQWTQDPGVGKQWLFRLTRDWQGLTRGYAIGVGS
jgi:TIR domain